MQGAPHKVGLALRCARDGTLVPMSPLGCGLQVAFALPEHAHHVFGIRLALGAALPTSTCTAGTVSAQNTSATLTHNRQVVETSWGSVNYCG